MARTWWVNQRRSYEEEKSRGLIFGGLYSRSGQTLSHRAAVGEVAIGDLTIHYSHKEIRAVGTVTLAARRARRPYVIDGTTGDEGLLAEVTYTELSRPIRLDAIPIEWREQEPTVGPFDVDGKVKVGYVFPVSRDFWGKLKTRFPRASPETSAQPIASAYNDGTPRFTLPPGETMSRDERMALFGGGRYGGIEPSASTPNIFLYSDPTAGARFGYKYDGWNADESIYLYTGEGQRGDQQMREGNRAIATHKEAGRSLRLFVADGYVPGTQTRIQRYLGEFEVDSDQPWTRTEAPDQDDLPRTVLVFRLRPVGDAFRRPTDASEQGDIGAGDSVPQDLQQVPMEAVAASVPAEAVTTASFERLPPSSIIAYRREAALAERLKRFLEERGRSVRRYKLRHAGSLQDLYTDLYDETDKVLYELKASASRESVRMALGQLLDYRRLMPTGTELAVLLPTPPADDLVALLREHRVACVVPEGDGFRAIPRDPTA